MTHEFLPTSHDFKRCHICGGTRNDPAHFRSIAQRVGSVEGEVRLTRPPTAFGVDDVRATKARELVAEAKELLRAADTLTNTLHDDRLKKQLRDLIAGAGNDL